jgi:O-antigen/teichoic acid export membrane protein
MALAMFDRVRRWIPADGFSRSVLLLVGSTAVSQALLALFSPVLTRIYTPEDFGVFGVFTSALALLLVVSNLRYEMAIPLADSDEDAIHLLALCLSITVVLVLLVCVGVWMGGPAWARLLREPRLGPFLWLLPVSLVGAGTYQALGYWMFRKRRYPETARTKIIQSASQVIAQVSFGILGTGAGGLILGDAAGRLAGSGALLLAVRRSTILRPRIDWNRMRAVASRFRRFPLISSLSAFLNSATLQLPPLLFVATYGPREGGWFVLGQTVIAMPSVLVGQAVAQVYLGEASVLRRTEPARYEALFFRTASRLALAGIVPVVLGLVAAPWAFSWIFGPSWREAGIYVRIMSASYLVNFVVWPLSQTLLILERQELQMYWDAGRLALVAGVFLVLPRLGLGPRWTVGALSLAITTSYIVFYWTCAALVRKEGARGRAGR